MDKKIIYYWNMKTSLDKINSLYITHIHLISIAFKFNKDNMPYIYLNNHSPYHYKYNNLWEQLEVISNSKKIIIVIGGYPDTFVNLFSYYDIFISILLEFLKNKSNIISGIDMIIDDEYTTVKHLQKIISDINKYCKKPFTISIMLYSHDFINTNKNYLELYNTKEGKLIDYFNCMSYYSKDLFDSFKIILNTKIPLNKIVIGCIYIDNPTEYYMIIENIKINKKINKKINNNNNNIGVCILEYNKIPKCWDYYVKLALSSV